MQEIPVPAPPPDIVFDLRKTRINPVYTMTAEAPFDIGIETRKEVKTLHFFRPKEVLKYQHALTNYLVLDNAQYVLARRRITCSLAAS